MSVLSTLPYHPRRNGEVCRGIDEDEGARGAVVLVAVGEEGGGRFDADPSHVVDADGHVVFHSVKGVDVNAVKDLRDLRLNVARGVPKDVTGGGVEGRFAEPANACVEGLGALWLVVGADQHVASAEVDVVGEGHGDAQWGKGLVEGGVAHEDLVDGAFLAAGQGHDFVAGFPNPRCDASRIAPEVTVGVGLGSDHVLDWEPAILEVTVCTDVHRFEVVKQGASAVPRRLV